MALLASLVASVVMHSLHVAKEEEDERQYKAERKQREKQRRSKLQGWEAEARRPPNMPDTPPAMMSLDAHALAGLDRCRNRGDWDTIRTTLQKAAYGLTRAPEEDKHRFATFAAGYVADDPLYREVLAAVLPAIQARPGLKQTETYALLPHLSQEWMRYALYYAAELGRIQRVKKGSSYTLWMPGDAPQKKAEPSDQEQKKTYWKERMPQLLETAKSGDRPFWQFRCAGDGRDPPNCQAVDGTVARFDHPFWKEHNPAKCRRKVCRCTIRSYTLADVSSRGLTPKT